MSARRPAITFTTDFGTADAYVGAMKGVAASIAPGVPVFDITHEIPAFDIAEGAYAIAQAYRFYPRGSVHVCVVDPGVGSERRPIAAAASGHLFVAPDNGVLSQVLEEAGGFEARMVDPRHGLDEVSATFHGRDLFAPAAARLAAGMAFADLGGRIADPVALPSESGAGRVLHVDRFGNVVTSFRESDLPEGAGLELGAATVLAWASCYASAPGGRPFLIVGSGGYVEVSLNRDSAARLLGVRAGDPVRLAAGGA